MKCASQHLKAVRGGRSEGREWQHTVGLGSILPRGTGVLVLAASPRSVQLVLWY